MYLSFCKYAEFLNWNIGIYMYVYWYDFSEI